MNRVSIIGLGLMGGSLGMALKELANPPMVLGCARRAEVRETALARGIVDDVTADPLDAARAADLVVFCVPVLSIPDLIDRCRPAFSAGAVVTDVASTKAELSAAASALLRDSGATFVGSHPMAGSDETGIDAARRDLYRNATVVVTPADAGELEGAALQRVCGFWSRLGSRVVTMDAAEHDRIVARTSHLPHIAAAALVSTVLRDEMERSTDLCGSGFRDTTRIAAGSELMWHDIIKTNRRVIADELRRFETHVHEVGEMIRSGRFDDVRAFLAHSRAQRRALDGEPS